MKFIYIVVIALFFSSCRTDEIDIRAKILWKTGINNRDSKPWITNPVESTILYQEDKIIVSGIQNDKSCLVLLETVTGKEVWRWQNLINPETNFFRTIKNVNTNADNTLIWSNNKDNYCIDLATGKTIWSKDFGKSYFSGDINRFFDNHFMNMSISGDDGKDFIEGGELIIYNNKTGNQERSLRPVYDTTGMLKNSGRTGNVRGATAFVKNLDTLLLLCFGDPPTEGWAGRSLLGLYNVSKKKWVYERNFIANDLRSGGLSRPPQLVGERVYSGVGDLVACNLLETGERQWVYKSKSTFTRSNLLIINNSIYGFDDYGIMFCLDKNTGQQIWKTDIGGNGSQIQYLNGVIYTNTAANLTAVDAETGKELWEVPSPDKKKANGDFDMYVGVVPGKNGSKGRIIVTTGYNAYCYEAIR